MIARRFAPAALALALSARALGPGLAEAKPRARQAPSARPARPPIPHRTSFEHDLPFEEPDVGLEGPEDEFVSAVTTPSALPVASLPPPFETGRAPADLSWSYEVDGLRVMTGEGTTPDKSPQFQQTARPPRKKGRKGAPPEPRRPETERVVIANASTPALVSFAWQTPQTASLMQNLSVPCRPSLGGPVRWPLRWETLRVDDSGAPVWQVNDGFYDEQSCKLSLGRRTSVRPAVLARQGQTPAVLAAREGDSVVFFVSPSASLQANDLTGTLRTSHGRFARVSAPVGPGLASRIVASFFSGVPAGWLPQPGAPPQAAPPDGAPEPSLLEVRVDVSQTVSERAPTLAVRQVTARPKPLASAAPGPGEANPLKAFLKASARR